MKWLKKLFGGGPEPGEARCVACEGSELLQLAPNAYRCEGCGYEGGDGYAAYKEGQRNAALAEESTETIMRRACDELESLRLALVAIGGAVARPSPGAVQIEVRVGSAGALGGAAASVDAEEQARLRQEREMKAVEAGASAKKVNSLIAALKGRPDAPEGFEELFAKGAALQVNEQMSNGQAQQMQTLCYELIAALSPG